MIDAEANAEAVEHDEALLRAAEAGDLSAYERLVLRYERPVFRLAYLILREARGATQMAGHTFRRCYASLSECPAPASLLAWLLRQTIEDPYVRQWRDDPPPPPRATLPPGMPALLPPEAAVVLGEQNRNVLGALSGLSPDEQLAVYLRYFLELDPGDVAAILRLSEEETAERFAVALQQLWAVPQRDTYTRQSDAPGKETAPETVEAAVLRAVHAFHFPPTPALAEEVLAWLESPHAHTARPAPPAQPRSTLPAWQTRRNNPRLRWIITAIVILLWFTVLVLLLQSAAGFHILGLAPHHVTSAILLQHDAVMTLLSGA